MRIINLLRLAKGFLIFFLIVTILIIVNSWTYSNVPLFTQFLIQSLIEQPGVAVGTATIGEVNLPSFLLAYFEKTSAILEIVLRVAIALIVLQAFRFTMVFFETWGKGYMLEKMAKKMRIKLYNHIQDLDYKFHNNTDTGDLIQRVTTDVEATTNFLTAGVFNIITLVATILFGSYQLFLINPMMVWVTLSMVPIVGLSSIIFFRKIDKVFIAIEETESKMMTVIQENLSGSRVVRAFANENHEIEKMEEKNKEHATQMKKANRIDAVYWGVLDFIGVNQYLLIIIIGVYFVQRQQMDAAGVVAALALVGMLIWPIRGLGRIVRDLGRALVASDRINDIFAKPNEYENDGKLTPDIKGKIEFRNVSFKFDDTEEYLLSNVSFKVEAGKTVAIIGRTGSGKSTIINLLLRMYDYQNGDILIDGIKLKDIKKKHIRKQAAAVLQEPFLYSKTVFENIAITNANSSRESVYMASEVAALKKDIKSFKQGYETIVGEKGTTLSGGQKQRVAIARVLVANKPILIFDDALSAVDTETDATIRKALSNREYKQTTIIITHRITTAKEADSIIVLDKGRIQAIGTHEELSQKQGLYKKLWSIQGQLEKEFLELIKAGDENDS